ncbi:hypothetical protein NZK32_01325 [Cyanobium sp. FGCU-52]|nr:hypothetical protein [Cyanobium sp. FGCU52]
MAAGLEVDRVGGIEAHLPPAHPAQLRQGLAVPVQIQPRAGHQAAVRARGVGEQQMAAEHQIEAAIGEGEIRQGGGPVAPGVSPSVGQERLQRPQMLLPAGVEIEIGAQIAAAGLGGHGEIEIRQGPPLQFLRRQGVERIHGGRLDPGAAQES